MTIRLNGQTSGYVELTAPAVAANNTMTLPSSGDFAATTQLGNRNLIINGAMQVAQRGTSTTAAGYLLDRFYYSTSGATGTYSQENFTIGQTDVPGADKYLKLDITTGDNNSGIYHKIEAKNAFSAIGKKVTLSYYAKGTSPTNGLQVGILWYDGSTSSSRADATVTLTNSWVKYTHTFDVPSISGLTLTNAAAYLEVHWQQAATDTGTAAYQLQLAQVQLEVGSVATPFEHRSYGDELRRCQRYFFNIPPGVGDNLAFPGFAGSTTLSIMLVVYPEYMRAAPTLNSSGNWEVIDGGQRSVTSFSTQDATVRSLRLNANCSGLTASEGNILRNNNDATATLEFSAEL